MHPIDSGISALTSRGSSLGPYLPEKALLSLTAIFLLDDISETLLFSINEPLTMADIVSLRAFRHAGWPQLARWFLPENDQSIAWQPLCAILARVVLLSLDFLLISLGLPRAIPVFTNDSGQLFFGHPLSFSAQQVGVINRPLFAEYPMSILVLCLFLTAGAARYLFGGTGICTIAWQWYSEYMGHPPPP